MTFSNGNLGYICNMEKSKTIFYWGVRLIAALIMLQTLYFKFTASEESVFIFTTVGMEPWGRIAVGALELVAAVLILINVTAWLGALLALGLMAGAIVMHLTILGVEVRGDGGQLFLYALIVAVCSGIILIINKKNIFETVKKLLGTT
jgi:putative oxidoreductase